MIVTRPIEAIIRRVSPPRSPAPVLAEPTVSVVIPAKNEARNIGWVLERIPTFVDEVIIVDGLSDDGTLEIAKMISPDVVVVHEMQPGKGAAVRAGFREARGDYVVMLDADGSMDPGEIRHFVDRLNEGYDLVKGSRFIEGGGTTDMTPVRKLGNAALLMLSNLLYGGRFSELCYGYMALRRSAIPELRLSAVGFEIETQIVTRAMRSNLRVSEVASRESERMHGDSNLNAVRDGLRILRTLINDRILPIREAEPSARPHVERSEQSGGA